MEETQQKNSWFEIDSRWLSEGGYRLDSSFYNLALGTRSHSALERWGNKVKMMSEYTDEFFYPPRLKRNFEDSTHGEMFFSSSQILEDYPETDTYLSKDR